MLSLFYIFSAIDDPRRKKERAICEVCGKSLSEKSELTRHMKQHLGWFSKIYRNDAVKNTILSLSSSACIKRFNAF